MNLNPETKTKLNLKGIAIGNPWTDPISTTAEMPSFAFSLGLIDYQER